MLMVVRFKMVKKILFPIFVIVLIVLSSLSVLGAEVEYIPTTMLLQSLDNYNVNLEILDDNTMRVTQNFDIVSRHKDSIIPGRAKLVLYGGLNPREIRVNIGGSLKDIPQTDVILEDGNNVIYYEIWRPIASGERLNIQVTFKTDLDVKGFLFKELSINFGEPELPIEEMTFSIKLPEGKKVTYSNPKLTSINKNTASILFDSTSIENVAELKVEYSSLPLPVLPFHGYWLWLIWILFALALIVVKLIGLKKR
jgi:hypothetical protein